jgi:thymidylate kinase
MEKLSQKLKFNNLILVEGLWKSGKTRLINQLAKELKLLKISEPNHLPKKIRTNISKWYYSQHKKRTSNAVNLIRNFKKRIIMERSLVSNFAYQYANNGKVNKNISSYIKIINRYEPVIIFLYYNFDETPKKMRLIRDNNIRKKISQRIFFDRYIFFYKKILPKFFNHRIIYIKN